MVQAAFRFAIFRAITNKHFPVSVFHPTEQAAELGKHVCILAVAAPNNAIGSLALRKIRCLGRLFAVIKELIDRDFEGAGKLSKVSTAGTECPFSTRDT